MYADNSWISTILGSACSGFVGRIVCHPFDTCKARLQAANNFGDLITLSGVFRKTINDEGISGLYRGLGTVLVGGIPGTCLYLSSYEVRATSPKVPTHKYAYRLANHIYRRCQFFHLHRFLLTLRVGWSLRQYVYVPVDVIKNRMQLQKSDSMGRQIAYPGQPIYQSSLDALRKIYGREGLSGLYKGYGVTLLSFGPFSSLYFLFYEESKRLTNKYAGSERSEIPFRYSLLCSILSGSLAAFITSPLDLAKLRIQVEAKPAAASLRPSPTRIFSAMWSILRSVYREEGLRGLYRGAYARVMFHAPCTALTVALFDDFRKLWDRLLFTK